MTEHNVPALRNVAIIAHVDHGKTTLVDAIIRQTDLFHERQEIPDCFLDSNDLERERGITILSKNISIRYRDVKINVIDTPGHCDFGGQVERVLNLADGVLLLVDAAEGPMPQTRFVLNKALSLNLKPIVVINKIDKPDARPDVVHEKVFDLFVELDASNEQLDFPLLYASGKDGWASEHQDKPKQPTILPVLDAIIRHVPPPPRREGPVQMQIVSLDYSDYVGRIGIGRVYRGELKRNASLSLIKHEKPPRPADIRQLFTFEGIERRETQQVQCGDLCAIVGITDIDIGDTIADAGDPDPLPAIRVDEPTISMIFRINDSPLYGKEGKFISSRHIRERLFKETERDVALQVNELSGDSFEVSGRGVLHLSILIENMRREGYELSVSQPHVIYKMKDGRKQEPIETLTVDVPTDTAGKVIEITGVRRAEMTHMEKHGKRTLLEFDIPTRGMIGLRSKLITATAGEAIISHRFKQYGPLRGEIPHRSNGVLVSMDQGKTAAYAIDALQQRGFFFVGPGELAYEGMIVGEHCLDNDLVVNVQKGKQLTNVRASGSDRALKIAPPRVLNLEEALEYIADDELVEATPNSIRLRKRYLKEHERKRLRRAAKPQPAEA